MDDKDVWLYSVIDHKNMSIEELQETLNAWSDNSAPNELLVCEDKMIIKFKSNLVRSAYFAARSATMNSGV